MHRPTPLALAAAFTVLSLSAQAQTAPRYTARDLAKPTSALYCASGGSLNARGDAMQACTYSVGSYTTTTQMCVGYLFCYPVLTTVKVTKNLPAVWPAGATVKALGTSQLSSAWYSTLLHTGDVVANGTAITTRGLTSGDPLGWRWLPPYGANGQTLTPPAALQGDTPYVLYGATQGGALWWRTLGGERSAVVTPDGQVKPVPLVPPPAVAGEVVTEDQLLAIQDGDIAVRGRWLQVQLPTGFDARHEVWVLKGQQWTRVPLPNERSGVDVVRIASNGRVLLGQGLQSYTWHPDQPQTVTLVNGSGAAVINASGVLGGGMPIPNDSKGRGKAVVWWQGQPLDLQGLTTGLPSKSWVLRYVREINDRGQLLVDAEDTSKVGNASLKTVLLTPQ